MTETVNTSSNEQAAAQTSLDEAAIMARAEQSAAARVEREASIETPDNIKAKKEKRDLSPLFYAAAIAGSYFMLHGVPGEGRIGRGWKCVVDHGTHIYIPPNPTPAHLQQAAQLAQQKGWSSVALFKTGGFGLNEKMTAKMQQVAPHLNVCTDRRQAGNLYSCRRAVIRDHIAAKTMGHIGAPEFQPA